MSKDSGELTARLLARLDAKQEAAIEARAIRGAELAEQQLIGNAEQILEAQISEAALALRSCMVRQYERYNRGRVGKAVRHIAGRKVPGFRLEVGPDELRDYRYSWQTPLLRAGDVKLEGHHRIQHGVVFELPAPLYYTQVDLYLGKAGLFAHRPINIYEADEAEGGEREMQKILEVDPDTPFEHVDQMRLKVVQNQLDVDDYSNGRRFEYGSMFRDSFRNRKLRARKDEYTDYSHVRSYSDNDLFEDDYFLMIGKGSRDVALGLMQQGLAELQ